MSATTTTPEVVTGLPIRPVKGGQPADTDVVARRVAHPTSTDCVGDVRAFRGTLPSRQAGFTFDTHHAGNKMPCGTWMIIARTDDIKVTRVNRIEAR
jgi:hypothetical protein